MTCREYRFDHLPRLLRLGGERRVRAGRGAREAGRDHGAHHRRGRPPEQVARSDTGGPPGWRGCYDRRASHALHPPDARHPPGGPAPARGPALQRRAQARRPAGPDPRARPSHRPRLQPPRPRADHLPGLAWLREIRWPVVSAVLDGEVVAGDGSEGIQAVFEARKRPGSPMAFAAFDVLEVDGQNIMGEPWTARRKRLEDLLQVPPPSVCLVPVTEDAPALWDSVGRMGDEASFSRSGPRSTASASARPPGSSSSQGSCSRWSWRGAQRNASAGAIGAKP